MRPDSTTRIRFLLSSLSTGVHCEAPAVCSWLCVSSSGAHSVMVARVAPAPSLQPEWLPPTLRHRPAVNIPEMVHKIVEAHEFIPSRAAIRQTVVSSARASHEVCPDRGVAQWDPMMTVSALLCRHTRAEGWRGIRRRRLSQTSGVRRGGRGGVVVGLWRVVGVRRGGSVVRLQRGAGRTSGS